MSGYEELRDGQLTIMRIACLSAVILAVVSAVIWLLSAEDGPYRMVGTACAVVSVILLTIGVYTAYRRRTVEKRFGDGKND